MADEQVVETPEQAAADAAAFENGFSVARGEPAPKAEPIAEVKQAEAVVEPEKKPEEKPAPDPWEGVPAIVRDRLEEIGKIDHRLKSNEGRLGSITKALEGLAATKAAAVTAAVADAPAKTQQDAKERYDKALAKIKLDYPDLADFVESAREELRAGFPKAEKVDLDGLKTELSTSVDKRIADLETKTDARIAQARVFGHVDRAHDGWEETIKTPEFKSWQAKQAPDIQALANSDKPKDAIRMLDLYEEAKKKSEATAKAKAANEARLRAAMTPKGVAAVAQSTTDEEAFESGFKAVRGGGR